MRTTRQLLGTAAVGALAFLAPTGRAQAQLVDFHGGAIACFYVGSVPCDPLAVDPPGTFVVSHAGATGTITYTSDTFTGTAPVPGSASFSDTPCTFLGNPQPNCGSFGHISVSSNYSSPGDLHIALELLFNTDYTTYGAPNSPATPTVTTANLPHGHSLAITGTVTQPGDLSGVTINWTAVGGTDNIIPFQFTNGGHMASCIGSTPVCGPGGLSGKATWTISTPTPVPVAGHPGGAIVGNISVASVAPEPATVALFATGLVGLIPVVRYRRRQDNKA